MTRTVDKNTALELVRRTMQQEIEALQALSNGLGEPFWQCAQLLSNCTGLVWVTAVGTSASVGARFAHILTCCGTRAMFLSPMDGLHGHTRVIQPGDLLVAMSRGGESSEVNQMAAIGGRQGAATIALVHNTGSTLAHLCSFVLPVPSPKEYELGGVLASTSTVAYSAMCDALCAVVMEAHGFSAEDFAHVHPGGAVGKVLTDRSVEDSG